MTDREKLKKKRADLLYHQQMREADMRAVRAANRKIAELEQEIKELEEKLTQRHRRKK